MLNLFKKIKAEQSGNALALVAVGMVVLLGSVALTTDGGYLYLQRQQMVNAVDSAALAAGQELPNRAAEAINTAFEYAENNGCPLSEVTVEVAADHRQVTVSAQRTVGLFFARVLGKESVDINVQATARIDPLSALGGAAPLSIAEQPLVFGIEYQLKDSPGDISDPYHDSGWLGPISLGGNGASVYRFNLTYGYDGVLRVGDIIDTETGNISGPTSDSIAYRIDQCHHSPPCTIDHFDPDCPRLLLVPVVAPIIENNQVKQVRVLGFASFLVVAYVESGDENYIEGYFVRQVVAGPTDPGGTDFGLYGVRLTN